MARIQHIKKARASKKTRRCRTCQTDIQVGEYYKKIAKKTGPRSSFTAYWCYRHNPKYSDTLSGRSQDLAIIQEDFDEAMSKSSGEPSDGFVDITQALEDGANSVEEMGEDIRLSAESIEDGFGHSTAQSEAMTETADEFDTWASEIRDVAARADEFEKTDDGLAEYTTEAEEVMQQTPDLNLQG